MSPVRDMTPIESAGSPKASRISNGMRAQAVTKGGLTRRLSYVYAGLFVLLPFWTLASVWLGATFGHLDFWKLFLDIAAFGLAILVLWQGFNQKPTRAWLLESAITRLFLLYVLLTLGLGIWALKHHTVNHSALVDGLVTNLRFVGFFVTGYVLASLDDFLFRNWIRLTLWPATLVVLFGLAQKFALPTNFLSHFGYGPKTVPAYQTVDATSSLPRLQSTLRGANPLGAYLAFVLPAWWVVSWRRWLKFAVGLLAGAVVLYFSYSRSAAGATVLAAALLIWWQLPKWRGWLALSAAALLIVGGGLVYVERNQPFVQDNLFHSSVHSTSVKSSGAARAAALRNGLSDAWHHPLGRGPGTAGPASVHNQPNPARIAENYFVQIAQEVGWLGLALFLLINVAVAYELWHQRAGSLAKILLATFVGITLINMVSHAWADETLSMLWWGLAGIACGTVILKGKDESR